MNCNGRFEALLIALTVVQCSQSVSQWAVTAAHLIELLLSGW